MSYYKPYPAYKESGIEWIGQVPEHWHVSPFKYHIERNDGGVWGNDPSGTNDTVVLRSTEQTVDGQWVIDQPALRNLSPNEKQSALLEEDDLVVTKSSGSSLHIGKTTLVTGEVAKLDCCYSNFMLRLRMKHSFLPKLAWYVMNNRLAREQLDLSSNSTTGLANLNGGMIGQLLLAIPPATEQESLVKELGRETTRIDALITKKILFIELLKEKRQALITHAVTKGLDTNVPMRETGVDWIGEVPEHWSVVQVRHVATLGSGHTPSRSRPDWWEDCCIPWFTLADIWQVRREGRRFVTETEEMVSELGIANSSAVVHPAGSVMLSRTASVGFPAIMGCAMATSQDFAVWRCGSRVVNEYLYLVLLGMKQELSRLMIGSTHKTIYMPDIEAFRMPLPPVEQQKEIIKYVGSELQRIDSVIAKTQRSIDLLKERRAAFITAAVTGQIDLSNQ